MGPWAPRIPPGGLWAPLCGAFPLIVATLLALGLSGACASPPPRADWAAHRVTALCREAEEALAAGDLPRARAAAQGARQAALEAGDALGQARALHVLGLLDGDPDLVRQAAGLLEAVPPGPEAWSLRVSLAEAALGAGQVDVALVHLEDVLQAARADEDEGLTERSRARAICHHLAAVCWRQKGDDARAAAEERQAALALTLVPETEYLPLRQAVQQAVGDAEAAAGRHREAFEAHAKAARLARRAGDRQGEVLALRCLGQDLVGMGRPLDAADQAALALRAAATADRETRRQIAQQALGWLDLAGAGPDDARRQPFLAALRTPPADNGTGAG